MFEAVPVLYEGERKLSKAQGLPVIGAIFVSPVKAVFSLALAVSGLATAILFATPALLFRSELCGRVAISGVVCSLLGFLSFSYSMVNMLSLGLIGFQIEWLNQ